MDMLTTFQVFTGGVFQKVERLFVNQTEVVLEFTKMHAISSLSAITTEVPLSKALLTKLLSGED